MFCLPAEQIPIFLAPAHGLYGKLKKISYQTCLLFYYFFGDNKNSFEETFDLYFHLLIIEFFWFV